MPDTAEQLTKAQLLPFHESVVEVIRAADVNQMRVLRLLLLTTKIPKGQDEIIAVWKQRIEELIKEYGVFRDRRADGCLFNHLLAQKEVRKEEVS